MKKNLSIICAATLMSAASLTAMAAGVTGELEELIVTASGNGGALQGEAEAASVGTVLKQQITFRPILRPAELLETIPGMVVTQHSGDGKANQYFLRGFNLDHGTDFANHVEGMPVNNVSHGHGQGYTDLNFLIPELVDRMVYKKGPYYASEGDFSSAGSARIYYANKLEKNTVKMTFGENNYRRGLVFGGTGIGDDQLVYGVEIMRNDGPWKVEEDFKKDNAVIKYTHGNDKSGYSVSAFYYDAQWSSTDQIPVRLVDSGELDRYGSLDPTTGGDTHRYSLAGKWWGALNDNTRYKAELYGVDYALRLTTNATYFSQDDIDDPDFRGDQFTQFDDRFFSGGRFSIEHNLNTMHSLDVGVSYRYDDIKDVGVANSQYADIYKMISRSSVNELALSGFTRVHSQWNDWFATIVGVRYDNFGVEVDAKPIDGVIGVEGDERDDLVSPKFSLRFGPFNDTEFFLNYGEGFHSNDARGVVDGDVPMLSASKGYELGMRTAIVDGLDFSIVFFQLDLDSELVFVGDDATTEPRGETRRTGVEVGAFYQPVDWFILDVDFAQSDTEFRDDQFDGDVYLGNDVPDSIERVFSIGASVDLNNGIFGGVRLRYFGPRKLNESGDRQSDSTEVVNANIGYRMPSGLSLGLEVINLLDSEDDDITYLYESRTRTEREEGIDPIEGLHSHPMEPRTVRATIAYEF